MDKPEVTPKEEGRRDGERPDGDVDAEKGHPVVGDLSCLRSIKSPDEMSSLRKLRDYVRGNIHAILVLGILVTGIAFISSNFKKTLEHAKKAGKSAEEMESFRTEMCGPGIFISEEPTLRRCVPGQFTIGDKPDCDRILMPGVLGVEDRIKNKCGDAGLDGLHIMPDGGSILDSARRSYEDALVQACGSSDRAGCDSHKEEIDERLRQLMPNYDRLSPEQIVGSIKPEDIDGVIALAFELGREDLARAATVYKRKLTQ